MELETLSAGCRVLICHLCHFLEGARVSFGYVKLHKRARDSRVFSDDRAWKLFTYCLMTANHKPGYFEGLTIERGQFATSLNRLAEDLGWTVSHVRTALRKCTSYGCISSNSAHNFTIVTISNYETYNCVDEDPSQIDRKSLANGSQADDKSLATIEEQQEQQESISDPSQAPDANKPGRKISFSDRDMEGAKWMWEQMLKLQPTRKKPDLEKWANIIRLMREQDKRTHEEIGRLFKWAQGHHHWVTRIVSPDRLRRWWDDCALQRDQSSRGSPSVSRKERVDDVYNDFEKPE